MNKQTKSFELKIDGVSDTTDGGLKWTGYVAAYDNVDSYGDIILKGAFNSVIGKTIPAFYEHYHHVGKLNVLGEDDYGLKVAGELMPDEIQDEEVGKLSAKLRWMMQNTDTGALPFKMSIGYYTKSSDFEKRNGEEVRILKEIELIEGSIVLRPANERAIITSWKSGDCLTLENINEVSERDIEQALKSGTKVSGGLAKYLVSCIKSKKTEVPEAEALDLKSIADKLKEMSKVGA